MTAKVIAEIGCNHKGDLEIAREMIMIAATLCKVDIVKFQKRTPREMLPPAAFDAPHPNPAFAYGPTYGAHREALEFTKAEHAQLQAWCDELGVVYSSSVWDLTSAKEIIALAPPLIKVPSACNLNRHLLSLLADTYGGEIHISCGMTSRKEEEDIVDLFRRAGRLGDLVLYACTSGYPVAFEDICLREITRLEETFGADVAAIGFSGHHLGIAADIAALTLGARFIERHYTLDRTWKGTDHAASLEPDGLRRLARDVRNVSLALTRKPTEILSVETVQRQKLKEKQIQWTQ